jgi:hypothetical protein
LIRLDNRELHLGARLLVGNEYRLGRCVGLIRRDNIGLGDEIVAE